MTLFPLKENPKFQCEVCKKWAKVIYWNRKKKRGECDKCSEYLNAKK